VSSFVGPVPISVIIVAILFNSALLAMAAARLLLEHHLSPETKGVVSVSVAVVDAFGAGSRPSHINLQRVLRGQVPDMRGFPRNPAENT
jgi:hypothetical protein